MGYLTGEYWLGSLMCIFMHLILDKFYMPFFPFIVAAWNHTFIEGIFWSRRTLSAIFKLETLSHSEFPIEKYQLFTEYTKLTTGNVSLVNICSYFVQLSSEGKKKYLTQGDNNQVDDRGLYPYHKNYLTDEDILGTPIL